MAEQPNFPSGSIQPPVAPRQYPAYASLAAVDPYRNVGLYCEAPWLRPPGLDEDGLLERYVVAGKLPDGLPSSAVWSHEWQYRLYLPDNVLLRRGGRSLRSAREALTRTVYQRIARMGGDYPIEPDLGLDTWMYRNRAEADYGATLATVLQSFAENGDKCEPCQEALAFRVPLLPIDLAKARRFGYRSGDDSAYYRNQVRFERYHRSRTGYFVPLQALEVQHMRREAYRGRFVALPGRWYEWEVPRGLHAELPPVMTYAWSKMLDKPRADAWAVFYSEWVACVAAAWLWEVYDSGRLFWLPPKVIKGIRTLDLSAVFGYVDRYAKAKRLLRIIESVDWAEVPSGQRVREHPRKPGDMAGTLRDDAGGDWVYVHLEAEEAVERDVALAARDARVSERPVAEQS